MNSLELFREKTKDIKGYVVASLTDEYIVDNWPMMHASLEGKEAKWLEVRVFNAENEIKLFRTSIGKEDFYMREIANEKAKPEDAFDEVQILDIDTLRSKSLFESVGEVFTTGGGKYFLPLENTIANMENAKVRIRYYLDKYEKTGQARICDWRLVDFEGDK